MFRTVLLKELHDHFVSLRFQAGFLLAFVLVSAAAFVLSSGFERCRLEQVEQQRREDDLLRRYAHLNRLGAMMNVPQPPPRLVLVEGIPTDAGVESLDGNPTAELLPSMDLATIVGFIFSLFAIVLGFDAVNGERERGTLRLILTNRVRRFTVLAAKWAGGMMVLATALAASLAAGCAIVVVRAAVSWNTADWLSVAGLYATSLLYCGAFFSLALAFSSLARRSSVSVLASVFAWVLLALIVPNLSPYAAARLVPLPSIAALDRDTGYITSEERDALVESELAGVRKQFEMDASVHPGELQAQLEQRLKTDPAFRARYEQFRKEAERVVTEVNRRQGARADRLRENLKARSRRQFELSRRLSYASPLPPFSYASAELALAGFEERKRFDQQTAAYEHMLDDYVWRRYAEEQRKNPAFGYNDYLDVGNRPRFLYQPAPSADRIEAALPYAGLLAAWNALFAFAAVIGFVRFDAR